MASGYQNIEQQHQASPYAPAPGTTPYQDQESLYTGPTSYGSTTGETVPERPSLASIGGVAMMFGCLLMFLSFIAAFITLIKIGGNAATLHTTIPGTKTPAGVNVVNALFIVGFIAFFNLFFPFVIILAELHFPMIVERVPLLASYLFKTGFYFFFAFINFGFAGTLGIAVGAMMIFNALFNGAAYYMASRQ